MSEMEAIRADCIPAFCLLISNREMKLCSQSMGIPVLLCHRLSEFWNSQLTGLLIRLKRIANAKALKIS